MPPHPAVEGISWHWIGFSTSPIVDPNIFYSPGNTSPWPAFAQVVAPAGKVRLIATAKGSTCLLDHPNRASYWKPVGGVGYARALAAWQIAGSPPVRAWLWHQGECDASTYIPDPPGARAAYAAALTELADAVWADYGAPLVAARIVEKTTQFVEINQGIADAAATHPHVYLGPWTDDLELVDDGQEVHVQDVETLGVRWANSVHALPQ